MPVPGSRGHWLAFPRENQCRCSQYESQVLTKRRASKLLLMFHLYLPWEQSAADEKNRLSSKGSIYHNLKVRHRGDWNASLLISVLPKMSVGSLTLLISAAFPILLEELSSVKIQCSQTPFTSLSWYNIVLSLLLFYCSFPFKLGWASIKRKRHQVALGGTLGHTQELPRLQADTRFA